MESDCIPMMRVASQGKIDQTKNYVVNTISDIMIIAISNVSKDLATDTLICLLLAVKITKMLQLRTQ